MTKKKYILFLNNKYPVKDNRFYLEQMKERFAIAVDGGIRFFVRNKIKPDLLIGDLDSLPRISKKYLDSIKKIVHPSRKDKTDSELAIDYVLDNGGIDIIICGALSLNQIDHTLANIFLLDIVNDYKKKEKREILAKMISPRSEIYMIENSSISLKGKKGDIVSILPLSRSRSIEYVNLSYSVPETGYKFGSSRALRNRMTNSKCSVSFEGKAIVVHLFDSANL